jgi:formylglycine-generating enzyme required for sulfatase activity
MGPPIPTNYARWLLRRSGQLELPDVQPRHGADIDLFDVYTPLITSQTPDVPFGVQSQLDQEAPKDNGLSFRLLTDLLNSHSIYVSGQPGSGKSLFCRWVTWLICNGEMPTISIPPPSEYQEGFPGQLKGRLPILVRLRELWPHVQTSPSKETLTSDSLEDALRRWLDSQKAPGTDGATLSAQLQRGTTLLVLDGIDEVPFLQCIADEEYYPRAMLLDGLIDAAPRWTKAGNRLLITARSHVLPSQDQDRLGLKHVPILGMTSPLQELLVRRWFVRHERDSSRGLETAAAMIRQLRSEQSLDELATNPLLLTLMCGFYADGKALPENRYLLYQHILETLLAGRYPKTEEQTRVRGRLGKIALGMHTGDTLAQSRESPEFVAPMLEVDLILQAYQEVDQETDSGRRAVIKVREELLSKSGLLVPSGHSQASFYHPTFQEFLAAERIVKLFAHTPDKFIDVQVNRGAAPGWRGTLSLAFTSLICSFSEELALERLRGLIARTAPSTSDRDHDTQGEVIWNVGVVIGDCLRILSDRKVIIPDDLKRFFHTLVLRAIEREAPVHARHALAVALSAMSDSRILPDLKVQNQGREHPGYVKIPSGRYLFGEENRSAWKKAFFLSRYPVTNVQYRTFWDDRGYHRREYWSEAGWKWKEERQVVEPEYWRVNAFNAAGQPVVGVSFWEAEAFCAWAGGGLPSESRWERAARGPRGTAYPWGDSWENGICNSSEAGLGVTSAVGIFPRSRSKAFQLDDMVGNVWEWCMDQLPGGRAIRGGSWQNCAGGCRSTVRYSRDPAHRGTYIGFRVAVDCSESAAIRNRSR